jgi:hypothetical protein
VIERFPCHICQCLQKAVFHIVAIATGDIGWRLTRYKKYFGMQLHTSGNVIASGIFTYLNVFPFK